MAVFLVDDDQGCADEAAPVGIPGVVDLRVTY